MCEYLSNISTIDSQFFPTRFPIIVSTVFQMADPTMVYIRNFDIFISLIPAGIEIKLLKIGTKRQ